MKKVRIDRKRCCKCGKVIAEIYKIDTGTEYKYESENTPDRFIDKWGFERNLCKKCVK